MAPRQLSMFGDEGEAEQARAIGLDQPGDGPPLVARWNLHAGRHYEEAKAEDSAPLSVARLAAAIVEGA